MFCLIARGKRRRDKWSMKLRLLLCGAALLAAGCDTPQNPYATAGEYSYTYDYVPQPVPALSPAALEKIYQAEVNGSAVSYSGNGSSEYGGR
jgi:hypothetical protein